MQPVLQTPRPISTAAGNPHRFKLEVRPQSPTRIEVLVLGAYKVPGYVPIGPSTPMPAWHGTGLFSHGMPLIASPSHLPDPALNEINESYALQLSVRDARGRIVAHGVPQKVGYANGGPSPTLNFQTLTFDLDRQLRPNLNPYAVTVRWRDDPDVSASSRMLLSDVPDGAETRVGERYIARPYGPADVYRLVSSNAIGASRRRNLISETEPRTALSIADDDGRGVGPIVSDSTIRALRSGYIGVPVYMKNFEFDCVDGRGRGALAELTAGKTLLIDTISRIGHVMTWLPDDPRQRVYGIPCNGDCLKNEGVFTDSPLVVGFKLNAADASILPQPRLVASEFDGHCQRGYAMFQNKRQFDDVFSLSKQVDRSYRPANSRP